MIALLPVLLKFRDIAYIGVIILLGGYIGWLKYGIAQEKVARLEAIRVAEKKSEDLSNELIIEQAKATAITTQKVTTYVDRIRLVKTPDNSCPADERMRIGSDGVRDIVRGGGP